MQTVLKPASDDDDSEGGAGGGEGEEERRQDAGFGGFGGEEAVFSAPKQVCRALSVIECELQHACTHKLCALTCEALSADATANHHHRPPHNLTIVLLTTSAILFTA
eukprot:2589215-Rhodomonas_salina.2